MSEVGVFECYGEVYEIVEEYCDLGFLIVFVL